MLRLFSAVFIAALAACSAHSSKSGDTALPAPAQLSQEPLPPEEARAMIAEVGKNWLYGQGLGETALTVGAIVAFPPYGLWVLSNAALSLGGYEEFHFSDALPEEGGEAWNLTYDTVTSAPGRVSAAIAGREFRNKEISRIRLEKFMKASSSNGDGSN